MEENRGYRQKISKFAEYESSYDGKQLIEELRCGNESAFRRIYDRHYVPLCRFADLFLHDASLSEEVVDDAIFYLWEHRSEVEITYSLKAYLMKSVRNRCLNELNSLAHREELQFSSFSLPENVEFLDTLFIEKDHPLGYLLEQELEEELERSIEALPEECRVVFKKVVLNKKIRRNSPRVEYLCQYS